MDAFDLLSHGLSVEKVEHIVRARQPYRRLMCLGLPPTTIKRIVAANDPCALKGTKHTGKVADLRCHHRTQKKRGWKYMSRDPASVAREASSELRKHRASLLASGTSVDLPDWTTGKQDTKIKGPRKVKKRGPSPLIRETDINDIDDEECTDTEDDSGSDSWNDLFDSEGDDTSLGDFEDENEVNDFAADYANLIDYDEDINISMLDGEDETEVEVTDSAMAEPDEYDIEMSKAEGLGLLGAEAKPILQIPGLPIFNPVDGGEEPERQTKRKRESVISPESPAFDMPSDSDHDEKRRKLETGMNSSQVPASRLRKKERKEKSGNLDHPCDLFCRSSTLAATFEAALEIIALDMPQNTNSNAPELDSIDLELLGEEPSDSTQAQPADNEDLKMIIGEMMLAPDEDVSVAWASANLVAIHQGSSNVLGLASTDREALKEAFGNTDEMQPSAAEEQLPSVVTPRTAEISDRCSTVKSLICGSGYKSKFKRKDKPIGPSKEFFQSLCATRHLQITEPNARFGAEFVAKALLDGRKSPLKKLFKDSQMSSSARRQRELRNTRVKKVSRREKDKTAKIASLSKGKGKERSEASPSDAAPASFMINSYMTEFEEELAEWEKEEEQPESSHDNA